MRGTRRTTLQVHHLRQDRCQLWGEGLEYQAKHVVAEGELMTGVLLRDILRPAQCLDIVSGVWVESCTVQRK